MTSPADKVRPEDEWPELGTLSPRDTVKAIRALRLNYRWCGVWQWLWVKHKPEAHPMTQFAKWIEPKRGGWWVLWRAEQVEAEQIGIADGVYW